MTTDFKIDDNELSKKDFDVARFLKLSLSATSRKETGSKSHEDIGKLRELRSTIQSMAEESSQAIKRNVFQNYTQFIDTAKEISYLESEMYQLNHLLTEQKNLIEEMMDSSFSGTDKDKNARGGRKMTMEEQKVSMQGLLEKVEGISHLADNPHRHMLLESDLTELDSENGNVLKTVHCFLVNDGFMLTSWIPHRLGPMRYKFESLYPLDSLAVVNVKDSVSASNAFKLLVFPEHKLFAAENSRLKRKWMDSFDNAKKQMLQEGSLVRQLTIRSKKRSSMSSPDKTLDDFKEEQLMRREGSETSLAEVEWLKELPDELDVCIAQRDFDAAIELLFEGRENLGECSDAGVVQEVKEKLVQKERNLVDVLSRELKVTSEKSLQGGPKATRKAITLLNKLGKSALACDLYLKNRSAVIKQAVKELRLAEDPLSYLRRLSMIVHGNLGDVAREFTKLFSGNTGCYSVLMLWSSGEMKTFVNLVLRHVIDPGPSLSVIGQSVKLIYANCEELAESGLDLVFELDTLLTPQIEKVIHEHGKNFLDATKLRISEDRWKPYNLQSESALNKFLEEMREIGLVLDGYLCEDSFSALGTGPERCRLWLTAQSCHFARSSIPMSRDLANLRLPMLTEEVDSLLMEIWRTQLDHLRQGVFSKHVALQIRLSGRGKPRQQKQAAEHCARFLIGQSMPLCEHSFVSASPGVEKTWTPLQDLLARDFPALAPFRAHESEKHYEMIGDV